MHVYSYVAMHASLTLTHVYVPSSIIISILISIILAIGWIGSSITSSSAVVDDFIISVISSIPDIIISVISGSIIVSRNSRYRHYVYINKYKYDNIFTVYGYFYIMASYVKC